MFLFHGQMFGHTRRPTIDQADLIANVPPPLQILLMKLLRLLNANDPTHLPHKTLANPAADNVRSIDTIQAVDTWDEFLFVELLVVLDVEALEVVGGLFLLVGGDEGADVLVQGLGVLVEVEGVVGFAPGGGEQLVKTL